MTTSTNYEGYDTDGDLTVAQRSARATAALVMLLFPMTTATTPLGFVALLPLIAIYPMFTAVVGWDPVRYVLAITDEHNGVSQVVARTGLVIIGTGLIGSTMLTSVNPLGGLSVLALLGILPIFVAIFGENPIKALFESSRVSSQSDQSIDQGQEADSTGSVDYAANDAQYVSQRASRRNAHHEAA
jgi:hypothetical protein